MKTPEPRLEWMRLVRPESLRAVFDHLPGVMFFAKDLAGRFTMANLAFAQRCGFPDEASLLGKSDADIFPAGTRGGLQEEGPADLPDRPASAPHHRALPERQRRPCLV